MLNKFFSDVKIIDYDCGLSVDCGEPRVRITIFARQIGGSAIAISTNLTKIVYSTTGKSILFERPHTYEAVKVVRDYLKLWTNGQMYCIVDESKNSSVILLRNGDDLLTLVHK